MALSPMGFSTDLSDTMRLELQRPERRDQVHAAVHMLRGMAEVVGIDMGHVDRFGHGVGGIGAGLMAIAGEFPWVESRPQP